MLSWLLWELVTTQVVWEDKDWTRRMIAKNLIHTYTVAPGGVTSPLVRSQKGKAAKKEVVWRPGWREEAWDQNRRWMWSEDHLRKRFDAFCDSMEAG